MQQTFQLYTTPVAYPVDFYKTIRVDGEEHYQLRDFLSELGQNQGPAVDIFFSVD